MTAIGRAQVVRADARNLPLPDASVDLVVTSPPYFGLRDYKDGDGSLAGQIGAEPTPAAFVEALLDCTREWMRVLKPEGSLWVNLGDKYAGGGQGGNVGGHLLGGEYLDRTTPAARKVPAGMRAKSLMGLPWRYAIGCIDDLGLILRAEVIWSKPNGLPESVADRVRRSHETWFHFTREPRYFAAVDAIREAHVYPNDDRSKRPNGYAREMTGHMNGGPNPLGKLPGSVWTVATQPLKVPAELGVDHFAAFPMGLPMRIISGWSPSGPALVVDPFGGTGTTALAARALGRDAISFDLSADYCRLADWRINDPGELARVLGDRKPFKPTTGQIGLFGEAS